MSIKGNTSDYKRTALSCNLIIYCLNANEKLRLQQLTLVDIGLFCCKLMPLGTGWDPNLLAAKNSFYDVLAMSNPDIQVDLDAFHASCEDG